MDHVGETTATLIRFKIISYFTLIGILFTTFDFKIKLDGMMVTPAEIHISLIWFCKFCAKLDLLDRSYLSGCGSPLFA